MIIIVLNAKKLFLNDFVREFSHDISYSIFNLQKFTRQDTHSGSWYLKSSRKLNQSINNAVEI